jgi:hypothetical protein
LYLGVLQACKKSKMSILNGKFVFQKLANGEIDKTRVMCIHCAKEFKYHNSVSSLNYHLSAKHAFVNKAGASDMNTGLIQTKLDQTCESTKPMSSAKHNDITNALARWIAQSGRPINIATDAGLQEVIRAAASCATYSLPARATISSRIDGLYDDEKVKVMDKLAAVPYVALTGDYWTSPANQSYLGVTAHFIDSRWELQTYALNVRHIADRHYADNCAEHFLGIANDWHINQKVTTFATDNARNVTAAVARTPFQNILCQAHTLQLSITFATSAAGIDASLAKCRKIVGHFKHSPANTMELHAQQALAELDEESLIQDVSTRWNSILAMLDRLLKHKDAVLATLEQHNHKLSLPTASEWDKLSAMAKLLQPCKDASDFLGGESYVSCSSVLPTLAKLMKLMAESDDDPAYASRFKTALVADIKRRLNDVLTKESKSMWFFVACLLDPRFKNKTYKFCDEDDRGTKAWEIIAEEVQKLRQNDSQQIMTVTNVQNRPPPRKKQRVLTLSNSEDEDGAEDNEIKRYTEEPKCDRNSEPLKWWSLHAAQYPLLSQVARKYLSTPATTVPSERLFSAAGIIVNKRRASLLPENVDKLTCLHDWLAIATEQK